MPTLDLNGAINKYAVYNGAIDAPLTDPMNNLASLLWHSDLPYIGVQNTVTGTVNLDPLTSGWVGTERIARDIHGNPIPYTTYPYTYTLHTHGLAYAPYFLGYIQVSGEKLPLNGSFLYGYNFYNVHSDGTAVVVVCDRAVSISFDYNVSCNFSLSILNAGTDAGGAIVLPPYFSGLDATVDQMRCGYFDTDNRYLIKDDAGDLQVNTGTTIDVQIFQPKYRSATCRAACIIFKSGSYVADALGSNFQSDAFDVPSYKMSLK